MFRLLLLLCLAAPPVLAQTADDILKAQEVLEALGYDLTVDGQESPAMTEAIKTYQRDWELPEDGILSDDLFARLTASYPYTLPTEQQIEGRDCSVEIVGLSRARLTVTHYGPCEASVREGPGTTISRYFQHGEWWEVIKTGTFRAGKLNGMGEYRWANGNVYVGDFVDDAQTGKGELRWSNGDVYIGDFVDDVRNGKGEYRFPDGSVYIGDFVENLWNGKGEYRFADGAVYKGDFVDNEFTGQGEFRYSSGSVYIGDFVKGVRSGTGELRYPTGDVYIGGFLNGRPHGHGVVISPNFGTIEGQWDDGCLQTATGWAALERDSNTCG